MIVKTEAIVLKSMRFRDTSKIVTFYSRRYGKIKGIAKGARDIKSKFGGTLEPLSRVSLVLYRKEQREIQLISQCDLLDRYQHIHSNISKMAVGLAMLELLQRATHDEEENAPLYHLLVDALEQLERAEKNPMNILRAFELRLGALFGYGVVLDRCVRCGRPYASLPQNLMAFFVPARGGAVCTECMRVEHLQASGVKLSVEHLNLLNQIATSPLGFAVLIDVNEQAGNEMDAAMRLYLRHHFEGIQSLRTLEVLHTVS